MNPAEFERNLKAKQVALKQYVNAVFPSRAGRMSVRFINGNFRAQGWQGKLFQYWKKNRRKGTILIKTGRGRRGTQFTTSPGQARIFNNVGYMAVHNRGFSGTVQIPAHQRRLLGKQKIESGKLTPKGKARMKTVSVVKGISNVKAHSRKMNIPKRKLMPTSMTDSPVLANAISRDIQRSLKQIFQ